MYMWFDIVRETGELHFPYHHSCVVNMIVLIMYC